MHNAIMKRDYFAQKKGGGGCFSPWKLFGGEGVVLVYG